MDNRKKIAIFTQFYPFGKGEEFLENELRTAENLFGEIALISFSGDTGNITKYLPENATVIPVREKIGRTKLFFLRFFSLFSSDVWRQTAVCVRERGLKTWYIGLKSAVLERSQIQILKAQEDAWVGKYDIYYSYWLSGAASYLALRKDRLHAPIISRAHGYDCFFSRAFHPHRKEQLEKLDMIFSISEAGRKDLNRQGCDPNKIYVARLGVDRSGNTLSSGNGRKEKTIVTCSNIVNLKRLDLMIEALSLIEDLSIRWVHFGDGVLKDYITELAEEKLSKKAGISYEFCGWVPQKKIIEFYQREPISVFVNCSDVEGIPVSIMEAMSYGIPCIARDVGGNGEVVVNNKNGILLPQKCSAEMLADGIMKLITLCDEDYMQMRAEAYRQYAEKYNAQVNYSQFWDTVLNFAPSDCK